MRTVKKIAALCLAIGTILALTACGPRSIDEVQDRARSRGFTIDTSRAPRAYYNNYMGIPVDIGSTKCSADFVDGGRGNSDSVDSLIIYGPDGKPLSNNSTGDKFYDPRLDSIKRMSQTAVCYPKDGAQK